MHLADVWKIIVIAIFSAIASTVVFACLGSLWTFTLICVLALFIVFGVAHQASSFFCASVAIRGLCTQSAVKAWGRCNANSKVRRAELHVIASKKWLKEWRAKAARETRFTGAS